MRGAWENQVFGGSIFSSIRDVQSGISGFKGIRVNWDKLMVKNNFREQLIETQVDHKTGGGFYVFRDVKTSLSTFADIYILIKGGVSNQNEI